MWARFVVEHTESAATKAITAVYLLASLKKSKTVGRCSPTALWTARVGARVLSTRSCQSNSNTSAHEERSRQSRLLRKPELSKEIRLLLHAEPKTPPPAASIGPTAGWSVLPGSFGNGWPWIAGVCRRASSPTHGLTIFPIACMSAPSTIRRQGSPTLWGSRCQQAFGP